MASLGAGQFEVADAHGAVAAADEGEKVVMHGPIATHRGEDGNVPARALWTGGAEPCLWSPARRTNPGIGPRTRGSATGGPRLGARSVSRHRSESDTGLAHDVQICCKEPPGRRTPRTEPRNHAVSSRPPGPRSSLCNRFGQTASPPPPPSTIHSPAARDPRPPTSPGAPIPRTGFSRRVRNEPAPATAPTTGRGGSASGPAGRVSSPSEGHR